jgi:uncharacterized protein (DUF362 family)
MRVYIEKMDKKEGLKESLSRALAWIGAANLIKPSSRIFIKPNLTWKTPTPGVTVTPAFLKALVELLSPLSQWITIGESEGGQSCFHAEEAFESHGLYDLEKTHGIRVVNLSKEKHEPAISQVGRKKISLQLPSMLLHETDIFISVPVPKIHAMTGVSLGFKNQWGCLGDKMRVTKHPLFDEAILAIHQLLKPQLCIFDGTYFLDYTGPMMGEPVEMDLVVAGNDVGAASWACCEIMQIDPLSIAHHRLALRESLFPKSREGIQWNADPYKFQERKFRLRRAFINYFHLAAFKNNILNRLFYDSRFADALHALLWFIRRNAGIKWLLYGRYGTGKANRGGWEE